MISQVGSVPPSLPRAGRDPEVPHITPTLPSLCSLLCATPKGANYDIQGQGVTSSQGCQVQLRLLLPATHSSVCSLNPVGNEFSGENADGQLGVQCKTKKSRRAGTKTVLLNLWYGRSSAYPLITLTVSVAYTCPCCSGGSQGPCKSSSFRRPQMHFLWDLVQKSWLLW